MLPVSNQRRLRVLFLPDKGRYPSEISPISGIFVREHAKAVSLYHDIAVLYAYPDPSPKLGRLYHGSESTEEGIPTIRVRYLRPLSYLWRLMFRDRKAKQPKKPLSLASNGDSIGMWERLTSKVGAIESDLLYLIAVFVAFRKLVKGGWSPDIIHVHFAPAGLPAFILGKVYHIPVIIHERGALLPRHLRTFLNRVLARFAMNRASLLIAPSVALRKSVEGCGVRNEFRIVPNAVDTGTFYPLPQQNNRERKRLLFVGNIHVNKGISYLLHALAQVEQERQGFSLDIVGEGAHRREFEELTRSLGLGEVVNFHGLKPSQEVARFMRGCDFFLLPSLSENLPCVLIEAMACGRPIIATDVGGVREIVPEENGILVPPGDVEALAQAVRCMLDNYASYSSEKIARHARERFSYEVVGEKLGRIYRDVAEGTKPEKR